MRTGGAETVAFEPTCLAGPAAALPHGAPSGARLERSAVVLFDFGAQVDGYRSDMTRTLFVGEPSSGIWPSTSWSRRRSARRSSS